MAVKDEANVMRELVAQNQLLVALADIRGKRIEHLEAKLEQQTHVDSFGHTESPSSLQWSYGKSLSPTVEYKAPSTGSKIQLSRKVT